MAQRLILHTGTMKSGTSFIQNVLQSNAERLADAGVLWPGGRWRKQIGAVEDLREHGGARQEPLDPAGSWYTLARQINDWPGTAIISMEFLGPRGRQKIKLIQKTFPRTDLQVVITARDLARCIPSMWQESVQNGAVTRWPEFLEAIRDESASEGPGLWFWRHQGVARMAHRWASVVGKDHYTLVTVPQRGAPPGTLLDRFALATGLDLSDMDLSVRANPSIGAATAMMLRRVNEAMADDPLPKRRYHRFVKHELAKRTLAGRSTREPTLGVDDPWVMDRGVREVAAIRDLGLRVVGDLDELLPRPVPGIGPHEVDASEQLDVAVEALAHVIGEWARPRKRGGGRKGGQPGPGRGPQA